MGMHASIKKFPRHTSQERLQLCHEALHAARSESASRLRSVMALQQQLAPAGAPPPSAALAAEREAREAAEARLREARTALTCKAQLVKDLRSQVPRAGP
jgi:hypothetical protein